MKPKQSLPAWDYVQSMAKLADLTESQYQTTLALSAMLELLVEKGVLSPEEVHRKIALLEQEDEDLANAPVPNYAEPTSSHSVDLS